MVSIRRQSGVEVEGHRGRTRGVDILAAVLGAKLDVMAADVLGHLGFAIERVRLLIPIGALPKSGGSKLTYRYRRIIDIRKRSKVGCIPQVRSPEPLQILRLQSGGGQAERIDNAIIS